MWWEISFIVVLCRRKESKLSNYKLRKTDNLFPQISEEGAIPLFFSRHLYFSCSLLVVFLFLQIFCLSYILCYFLPFFLYLYLSILLFSSLPSFTFFLFLVTKSLVVGHMLSACAVREEKLRIKPWLNPIWYEWQTDYLCSSISCLWLTCCRRLAESFE